MDRRQAKTHKAIFNAFEGLMSEGHYSQVTVAQIIMRADIGRSTFYAHFETKDDLLECMCEEMFAHVFAGVDDHCETHRGLATNSLEGKLAHLLFHLRDSYSGICGKLVAEGEPHFVMRFCAHLADLLGVDPMAQVGAIPHDLLRDMRASAFCQTVTWWHENDWSTDPKVLASWFVSAIR